MKFWFFLPMRLIAVGPAGHDRTAVAAAGRGRELARGSGYMRTRPGSPHLGAIMLTAGRDSVEASVRKYRTASRMRSPFGK